MALDKKSFVLCRKKNENGKQSLKVILRPMIIFNSCFRYFLPMTNKVTIDIVIGDFLSPAF